jgi:hypothetical protein
VYRSAVRLAQLARRDVTDTEGHYSKLGT